MKAKAIGLNICWNIFKYLNKQLLMNPDFWETWKMNVDLMSLAELGAEQTIPAFPIYSIN